MGIAQSDRGDSRAAAPASSAGGIEHAGIVPASSAYIDRIRRHNGDDVGFRLFLFEFMVFSDHAAGEYSHAGRQLHYP